MKKYIYEYQYPLEHAKKEFNIRNTLLSFAWQSAITTFKYIFIFIFTFIFFFISILIFIFVFIFNFNFNFNLTISTLS